MRREHKSEKADRTAEERSENGGTPEHHSKARGPMRWGAERRDRVSQSASLRPVRRMGLVGMALLS